MAARLADARIRPTGQRMLTPAWYRVVSVVYMDGNIREAPAAAPGLGRYARG